MTNPDPVTPSNVVDTRYPEEVILVDGDRDAAARLVVLFARVAAAFATEGKFDSADYFATAAFACAEFVEMLDNLDSADNVKRRRR